VSDQRPEPPRLRRAGLIALACVVLLATPALLLLTSQASFPPMSPRAPALPSEGRRLVVVLVDGLRYDCATDPDYAPNFARNMQRHSSAEVWAGQITMTSAATLAMGTGTRGSFAQVVLNVETRRTQANHLFENARSAGLRTGLIGDPVWFQAYGEFDFQRLSRGDLALDVDDTPELFEAAHALIDKRALPDVLMLHFFAIDHLQHSFGVFSTKFREFFLRFDADLQKFLDALPENTTVVALSDHGALANGNHGVDSDLERKTPMFAYGPGVRPGQKLVLEQVDVAPTLAALLGVASPAHGIGIPVTQLLEAEPSALAGLACAEAERIGEYGRKAAAPDVGTPSRDEALCRDPGVAADQRIAAARRVARHWDAAIADTLARRGLRGFVASLALLLACGALVGVVLGHSKRRALFAAASLALPAAATVALTVLVDHTLPPWNDVRAALMWAATLLLALYCFAPRIAERASRSAPLLALSIVPGWLLASFPTNTQLHAGIVATLLLLATLVAAVRARLPRRELALALLAGLPGAAIALRVGTVREDALAAFDGWLGIISGVVSIGLWLGVAAAFSASRTARRPLALELGVGLPVAALTVLPHSHIPAMLGLSLLVVLPALALVAARRGYGILARALLFAAYGLVSRPVELVAVAGALLLAEAVGGLMGRVSRELPGAPFQAWPVVLVTTAAFAFGYVARLGVQAGLDFVTMDWGAGSFDSTLVPPIRITLALVVKYGASLSLVTFALLSRTGQSVWRLSLALLTLGLVLRLATMDAILFAPWVSFWSRYRMLGELGPVLLAALIAAIACIITDRRRATTTEPTH
jgi:hypothetical protein